MEFEKKQKTESSSKRRAPVRRGQRSHLAARSLTSGSGDRIKAITDGFEKLYKNDPNVDNSGLEIKLTPMPKNVYGDDYDVVVITGKGTVEIEGKGEVSINMSVPLVLEDNSNPLDVRKVVSNEGIFLDTKKGHYVKPYDRHGNHSKSSLYFPTDVLEDRLKSNIEIALDLPDDGISNMLDGVLLSHFINLEDEGLLNLFAGRCIDPILDYWEKLRYNTTLNIKEMCRDSIIKTNFFTHKEGNIDALGISLDDTFTMRVYTSPRAGDKEYGPNNRDTSVEILEVNGVISLVPGVVSEEINGRNVHVEKLVPVVVAKDIKTSYILEDALLTVASLSYLVDEKHWMDILIDTASETRDPGMMLKAIGETPKPFSKKGVSRDAKEEILFKHCTNGGTVAIDLAEYSLVSGPFSVIQSAAMGNVNSLKEILMVAVDMCKDGDGKSAFNPSFSIHDILESVELPNGYFDNTDGSKHSLASIDPDYIATTHPKYLDVFISGETSSGDEGLLDIIGVYNDIGLSKARLTGIRRRIVFTKNFIIELTDALAKCGYVIDIGGARSYRKELHAGYDYEYTRRMVGQGGRGPRPSRRTSASGRGMNRNYGSGFIVRRT